MKLFLLCLLLMLSGCAGFRLHGPHTSRATITAECQRNATHSFRLSVAAAVLGGCATGASSLGGMLQDYPRAVLGLEVSGATCAATGGVLGLLSTYYASQFTKCSR